MSNNPEAEAAAWFVALLAAQDITTLWPDFRRWLDACPENRAAFRAYERLWQLVKSAKVPASIAEVTHVQEAAVTQPSVPGERDRVPRRRRLKPRRFLTAALTIGCLWLEPLFRPAPITPATVLAWSRYEAGPREVRKKVRLSDHSVIRLDPGTLIHVGSKGQQRHVIIERGRALFNVNGDPGSLEVLAGPIRVVAFGTIFSVARPTHDEVQTIVNRGRVMLIQSAAPPQMLNAGEAAQIGGEGVLIMAPLQGADPRPQWVKGVFKFHDTPLSYAVAAFNHYNECQLRISDPNIAEERIGGRYKANNPLSFARSLQGLDIRYVLTDADGSQPGVIRLMSRHP